MDFLSDAIAAFGWFAVLGQAQRGPVATGLGRELQNLFCEFDGSRWISKLGRGAIGQEPREGVGGECRTGTGSIRRGRFEKSLCLTESVGRFLGPIGVF